MCNIQTHKHACNALCWQAGLSELAGSVAARQAAEGGAAAAAPATSSYDRLYALGSRIKYLIDTPETIYGCLDSGDHLAAVSQRGK